MMIAVNEPTEVLQLLISRLKVRFLRRSPFFNRLGGPACCLRAVSEGKTARNRADHAKRLKLTGWTGYENGLKPHPSRSGVIFWDSYPAIQAVHLKQPHAIRR